MPDNTVIRRFPEIVGPGGHRIDVHPARFVVIAVVALVVLMGVTSSYYTIPPDSTGVVLRFGRKYAETPPGLHSKLPFGIDQVYPVPVSRQLKQEFGFRTLQAGVRSQYLDHTQDKSLLDESLMVTGDLNTAIVEWIVQYRIEKPTQYLFDVREPEKTFRDASEAVMREMVGDHTVDEVLTVGRQAVATAALTKLQELMNTYQIGIKIEQVVLQDVNPPDEVKASFNEVNQAQQERERTVNEARTEYNQAVPRAKGEAEQKIRAADGYAMERVNRAQGEATRFTAMMTEYQKAPDVTRRRIYLETMETVLPRLGQKYVVDEGARGILPLLQLNSGSGPLPTPSPVEVKK